MLERTPTLPQRRLSKTALQENNINSAKDQKRLRHVPVSLSADLACPVQQLAALRRAPRNAAPGPAAPGNGCLVPTQERPKRPCTFYISVVGFFCFLFCFFFLTDFFPSIQLGQKCLRFKQLKERPSLQVPSCFGTEFCSWLKFFSFQNTNGHFSWKSGIWPGKEAKCENTAENSMLFFRVVQPAPLMRDHRSLDS